jgi:hypothetical protein
LYKTTDGVIGVRWPLLRQDEPAAFSSISRQQSLCPGRAICMGVGGNDRRPAYYGRLLHRPEDCFGVPRGGQTPRGAGPRQKYAIATAGIGFDARFDHSGECLFRLPCRGRSILAVLRGIRECGDGCVIRDDVRFDREGTTVGFALDRLQVSALDLDQKS